MENTLSDKFRPDLVCANSLSAYGNRAEQGAERNLASTVESVLAKAISEVDSSLRLGENVGWAVISERDLANYAQPAEEAQILSPRACQRKRDEFTLGRASAHFAMREIGLENPGPVLRGTRGEPLWRNGIAGSITHRYPWSVAVVAKCSGAVAIGVDLESVEAVGQTDISRLVCRDAELTWVRQGDFQERLTMIFSAKEALYKALYPLYLRYIDFMEVELTPFPQQHEFQGEFAATLDASPSQAQPYAVHCRRLGELVFSCVIHDFQRNRTALRTERLAHSVSLNRIT